MAGNGENAVGGPARHIPVLLDEVLAALAPAAGDLVVDATFGAGGYTRAILDGGAYVIAIDRDPDAIADLVFARARAAMLCESDPDLPPRHRVERALWRWFDALAPDRKAAVAMLRAKLHPPHVHTWAPLPFHLSRLIWWLREASLLDAGGRRRQAEEIALSALFLAALASWAGDASAGQSLSRRRVARLLDAAERLLWPKG